MPLSHCTTYSIRKKTPPGLLLKVVFCILFTTSITAFSQENVGIGTSTPDSSAILELSTQLLSTPKGVLLPRLTTAQRDAIILPAPTLLIYNTTTSRFEYNIGTAAVPLWTAILTGNATTAWALTGNSNTNPAQNFLGTTDAADLIFKTDNSERLRLTSSGNLLLKSEATASELQFFAPYGSGLYYTAFKAGLQSTNITYTLPITQGASGTVLRNDGTGALSWVAAGSGSVTSVGLSLPSIFDVSGSPVTSTGTLTATFVTQAQNKVFAGPATGADAIPTFRLLDPLDIPNLDAGKITTGILPIARGGTNSTAVPIAGAIVYGTGTAYAFTDAGTTGQVLTSNSAGVPTWTTPSSYPTSFTAITNGTNTTAAMIVGSGASLTFSGTGTITANQYTGSGSTSTSVDLATAEVAGVLPIANGGTNSTATPTAGAIPYGTGTAYAFTAAGTAGQILTSNGAGAPTWAAPSSAPTFDAILSGTNTTATMIVGSGASLSATGTGTITANQYTGSGSTSTAVDLATAEVAGVLPIANGGTNSTATPTAGGVVYGTGTAYGISAAGTTGQVLSSNGAGAPAFRALTASDISSGTLSVSQGGTGATTLTGILVGNGTSPMVGRTLTGTANQISIANADGTAGNPTFSITTNPILPGNASSSGTFTAGTGLTVTAGGATITAGGVNITAGGLTVSSGTTTLTPLSTGIVHSSSSGVLSSSAIALSSADVSGILPVANGGTGVATITGILAGNGTTAIAGRTITGTANQITVTDGNGAVANPTLAITDNPILPGSGSVTIPSGTDGTRPGSPVNGMMRYNTDSARFEFYQNNQWVNPLASNLNGSGKVNKLPKFAGSTDLGSSTSLSNSNIYDNGTSVGIKDTTPSASAALSINSTSQGFLPPRMLHSQKDAITSPAEGLTVYITDSTGTATPKGIYYYDGAAWRRYVRFVTPTSEASMRVISKSTAQTRTGTTTPVDDSELSLPISAGETWIIDAVVFVTASTGSGNVNFKFSLPTGATLDGGYHVNAGTNVSSFAAGGVENTTQYSFQIINNSVTHVFLVKFVVTSPTNGGNIVFAWAPSDSGNTLTVKRGSYFIAARGAN
ncbi:MAG: hypothetical protein V4642_04590 [Bacteroidota bacterium]